MHRDIAAAVARRAGDAKFMGFHHFTPDQSAVLIVALIVALIVIGVVVAKR